MTTAPYFESTATDVYQAFLNDTSRSDTVFATGLGEEQAAALVKALAESDDAPTVHLLVSSSVLNWVRRDFHLASTAAELVADGTLSIRVDEASPTNSILVTEDVVLSLVTTDERIGGLTIEDGEFVKQVREERSEAWETADAADLRTPARSHIYEILAEKFGNNVETDYRVMLDAIGTTRTSGSRTTDNDILDEVELALLAGAKQKLQLFELSTWGEDVGLASRATFSRTKIRLEDEGIIETEKIPMEIGRPRQRLLLADQFCDYDVDELPTAVRNELLCRIARRSGSDTVISVESEEADCCDFGNPPLHPRIGCES